MSRAGLLFCFGVIIQSINTNTLKNKSLVGKDERRFINHFAAIDSIDST
jgi:hypothetical protein